MTKFKMKEDLIAEAQYLATGAYIHWVNATISKYSYEIMAQNKKEIEKYERQLTSFIKKRKEDSVSNVEHNAQ